ncbi:MAG: hypothetical protein U0414_19105 [Polyangiaceae bacterium]
MSASFASPICGVPSSPPSNGDCYTPGAEECNPVSGASCAAGEACDFNGPTQFVCWAGENSGQLCGSCDPGNYVYCENGLECFDTNLATGGGPYKCFKFCCQDADCGGGAGTCNHNLIPGGLGLCATVGP